MLFSSAVASRASCWLPLCVCSKQAVCSTEESIHPVSALTGACKCHRISSRRFPLSLLPSIAPSLLFSLSFLPAFSSSCLFLPFFLLLNIMQICSFLLAWTLCRPFQAVSLQELRISWDSDTTYRFQVYPLKILIQEAWGGRGIGEICAFNYQLTCPYNQAGLRNTAHM